MSRDHLSVLTFQLFKEDPETGLTHVALSSDSTCVNNLYSSQDGYETLHMAKEEQQPRGKFSGFCCTFPGFSISFSDFQNDFFSVPFSGVVPYNPGPRHPKCIFPDWMQGRWEGLSIEGGSIVYRGVYFN